MFRQGIIHTGKAMAGEEEPVREGCLVQGVGPGSGGNRVRFQEVPEQDGVPAAKSGVGVEAPNGAQVGPRKTPREKIFEAVEALRLLLGQGVCSQVEDLIQEHIPPLPKVTLSPPHSPTELERAQPLAKLLEDKAKLEKNIQGVEERGWQGKVGGVSGRG